MATIFSPCPHDLIHDPAKWQSLVEELNKATNIDLKVKEYKSFENFQNAFPQFGLVYAHLVHAINFTKSHKFIPVAIPNNLYDEAVIVASKDIKEPSLDSLKNAKVACIPGTPSLVAAMNQLSQKNINIERVYKDNYYNVLMDVSMGKIPYGFILRDIWEDFTPTEKSRVNAFHITNLRSIFHIFLLSDSLKDKYNIVKDTFLNLHSSSKGGDICKRLRTDKFIDFNEVGLKEMEFKARLAM